MSDSDLNKILDKFREETEDLWEQFMEGDDPDPQKYDDFLDNAYKTATQSIKQLLDKAIVNGRVDELENISVGEPELTELYILDRIKTLRKGTGE